MKSGRKPATKTAKDANSELAQRVTAAFRESARAAVEGHLKRGEMVVGIRDGQWVELNPRR